MKSSLIFLITLFVTQILSAQNISQPSTNTPLDITTQGGVLKFENAVVERFNGSQQNSDQILLTGYEGQPLKALQFDIIVGKNGGNLILKSVERGSDIPASAFLFDYEIYKGTLEPNGSSIDTIKVLFLGNGMNELLPAKSHHIITITYDVISSPSTNTVSYLSFENVIGATSSPVQNANILTGEDQVIHFIYQETENESKTGLLQNYPNPFNPSTTINFFLNGDEHVTLKIFNSTGEEIKTVLDEFRSAGNYEINFDAAGLASGVYLCRVSTNSFVQTKKMILLR